MNFLNVIGPARLKPPFGIAQIGKAFRNEISPGNFIFRSREFEQMEMQYFIPPDDDRMWFEYWREQRMEWYRSIGLTEKKMRFHDHGENELAHYAKEATDIEYEFPFGLERARGDSQQNGF